MNLNVEVLFKALADNSRLQILSLIMEKPRFVEELSKELNISVSTASFHLKKLQSVGFLVSKKEQYYKIYSINNIIINNSLASLIKLVKTNDNSIDYFNEVINECFENGKLKKLPVQIKKQEIVLKEIIKLFKYNKIYSEKEVNLIIADVADDFVNIREMLINFNLFKRVSGGIIKI